MAHVLSKDPSSAGLVRDAAGKPLTGNDANRQILATFGEHWFDELRSKVSAAQWDEACEGEPPLPPPTVGQLRQVCKAFADSAGLGYDAWNPKGILLLPEEMQQRLLDLLEKFEASARLPLIWLTIMFFIAKIGGQGVRPIGLLAGPMRVWSRLRRPMCAAWEERPDVRSPVLPRPEAAPAAS